MHPPDVFEPAGLINSGSRCFLNAGVQFFLSVPEVLNYFLKEEAEVKEKTRTKKAVVGLVQDLTLLVKVFYCSETARLWILYANLAVCTALLVLMYRALIACIPELNQA